MEAGAVAGRVLLAAGVAGVGWGTSVERSTYFLEPGDQAALAHYAVEAEQIAASHDRNAVEAWRQQLQRREHTWVAVLDARLQSLGTQPLTDREMSHLTFMRKLTWPMSKRLDAELPYVSIAFAQAPAAGRLVIQLPQRLLPPGLTPSTHLFTHGIVPAVLALALGLALYRHLVVPLTELRERANALRSGDLAPLAGSAVARRHDELGELARAYEHMAERLRLSLEQQRQLLRTLSHEIRTPLVRLQVASESDLSVAVLQQRVSKEVDDMQRLVEDALNLAWLDAEKKPQLKAESVVVASVWEPWRKTCISRPAARWPRWCASLALIARCMRTSIAWPKPSTTSCATRCVIRRRTPRSA